MHSSGTQFKEHNFCQHRSTFPPLADAELAETCASCLHETRHKPVHSFASTKSLNKTMTNWELTNCLIPEDNHVRVSINDEGYPQSACMNLLYVVVIQVSILQFWSWSEQLPVQITRKESRSWSSHNVSGLGSVGKMYCKYLSVLSNNTVPTYHLMDAKHALV
jgi:hypothetical protein